MKNIKCTCPEEKNCSIINPSCTCNRAKIVYAKNHERSDCKYKPKITKYRSEGERGDFMSRNDQYRKNHEIVLFVI